MTSFKYTIIALSPVYVYLHVLHDDGEFSVRAVLRQQVLAGAGGREELVVEGLDVRLTHHQTLTCWAYSGRCRRALFKWTIKDIIAVGDYR